MKACRSAYQGDEVLARLLKKSGSVLDVQGVRALLPGVLAAPPGEDADRWMMLVGPEPGDALEAQLRALLQASAEARGAKRVDGGAASRTERVVALRKELARRGIDGFIVPRADEHQGEYVPPRAERLAWLTGFTGSAGMAVVLPERAAIFVDGRYTLQVRAQVDPAAFELLHSINEPPEGWVEANLKPGQRLGYDPWLHTPESLTRLRQSAEKAGGSLVACAGNPLDAVWEDQPPHPIAPVVAHGSRFAGRDSADKRQQLAKSLADRSLDAAVLTAPDSIAWLLNIRGGDVPRTPLPLSFAILHRDGAVQLFIDRRKLVPGLETHLGNAVAVQPPESLGAALDALARAGRKVLADPATAAAWIFDRLAAGGSEAVRGDDPCALPKACKNPVEIEGIKAAHRRDGAAVTRFLAWLSKAAAAGGMTEIDAAERLADFRRGGDLFRDFSFDTIAGAGPNGAIVHYRVTPATNRRLEPGQLFLIDSGAQYLDGTTDITRTVAIGTPSAEMRDRFTRVLKGHIALAEIRFPRGTTGSQLDTVARTALWQAGLDYDHGTGHGVGTYLGVHEGPQRISKLPNRVPLEVGMVVSNEPGYYKTNAYGIRIENLITVVPAAVEDAERTVLAFETLTLVPIDRNLIDLHLMTPAEIRWVDSYHARVRQTVTPLVDSETVAWLADATRPLSAGG